MAILTVGTGEQYSTLASAIAASQNGDTIEVQAGTYTNDFATITDNITIEGVGGMVNLVATQDPPNGKAILVTDGNDTIENVSFSGAVVPDGNGAGIRYETGNLVLINDYFHDNQDGLLGGNDTSGSVKIENTEFANNGVGDGQTHNLYVGEVGTLTVENSLFTGVDAGHEIKSRADNTIIEDNRIIDGPTSTASYSIDIPDGGNAVIENNIIEKGPNAENETIIHYGGEGGPYANSSLTISGNTVINDMNDPNADVLLNQTDITASVTDNQIYGVNPNDVTSGPATQSGNSFLTTEPALDFSPPFDPSQGQSSSPPQLSALQPGQWADLSGTELATVVYDGPLTSALFANTGPSSIMSAWSGGTFDTATDSLLVWGGGHSDYAGNEVYAFSLQTLTWSMLDQPSPIAGYDGSGILLDGTPASRHTYDGLTYLPGSNQMFETGGAHWANGYGDSTSWLFNPTSGTWQQAASDASTAGYGDVAAYDPVGQDVFEINEGVGLQEYDPAGNSWKSVGTTPLIDYHMTGAVDPIVQVLVAVGTGHIQVFSLSGATLGSSTIPTASGDMTAQNANAPGFVWDSAANLFVAWNGGSTLYTLDPQTWQWTAHPAFSGNTVVPPAEQTNGTFGRFQYDAADNLFVVANDINQDVYVFKPDFGSAGSGTISGSNGSSTIDAVAPQLTVTPASGSEGNAIPLSITATQASSDLATADLTVTIAGLDGATLNHGSVNADGSVTLHASDLSGLTLTPAVGFTGTLPLTVTATDTEPSSNTSASSAPQTQSVSVGIPAVAPDLTVASAIGPEGIAIPLSITATQASSDLATADLAITITGLDGATLNHGSVNADGSVTLHASDLSGLTLTPAAGFTGSLRLTVTATDTEPSSNTSASSAPEALSVSVDIPAVAPHLTVAPASGTGGTPIPLQVTADQASSNLATADLTVTIAGLHGAILNHGSVNADGSVTLHAGDLPGLTLSPAAGFTGTLPLTVTATDTEPSSNTSASSAPDTLFVSVGIPAVAPDLTVAPASGTEGTTIPLDVTATQASSDLATADLTVTITGLDGAHLNHGSGNANGSVTLHASDLSGLTLTPAAGFTGTLPLHVTATDTEPSSGTSASSPVQTLNVSVGAATSGVHVPGVDHWTEFLDILDHVLLLLERHSGSSALSALVDAIDTHHDGSTDTHHDGSTGILTLDHVLPSGTQMAHLWH